MIRDPDVQVKKLDIPKDALSGPFTKFVSLLNHLLAGHAYHTYHLSSPDKTVNFEFQHNVAGTFNFIQIQILVLLFRTYDLCRRDS